MWLYKFKFIFNYNGRVVEIDNMIGHTLGEIIHDYFTWDREINMSPNNLVDIIITPLKVI